jgi:tRNA (guanine-N7-)-methyltransferase
MTSSQQRWLSTWGPRWIIDMGWSPLTPSPEARPLDLDAIFGRGGPLVVEIGIGHGESIVARGRAWPQARCLGFEVFDAALASTLGKIAAAQIDNVRLLKADAVWGLTTLLAPASIDELLVFFPDPWPKKRHHKRRLLSPAFVALAATRLRPGGVIRVATDWDDYARAITEAFATEPRFHLESTDRFAGRPVTKFEARALAAGRTIHDFAFRLQTEDDHG